MKIGVIVAILAGFACAVAVIAYFGAAEVFRAIASVGWGGFLLLCAYALLIYLPLGAAWRVLLTAERGAQLGATMWGRLMRDTATELLPFSSIGGFVIGARAATVSGMSMSSAFASSLVDLTTELFAQIAFILIGGGLWLLLHTAADNGITLALGVGLGLFIIGGIGFFVLQRRGLRTAANWVTRTIPSAQHNTEEFHAKLDAIYDNPAALAWSSVLHLVGWLGSAFGVWIAFRLIGVEADLFAVIAIEAIVCALRSSAFFVPSAIGVQEAGYAFIAPAFGLPADAGLAISLLKRGREIATGVIALAVWQVLESRRALRSQTPRDQTG